MGLLSTPLGRLAGAAAVTAGGVALLGGGNLSTSSGTTTSTARAFSALASSSVFVGTNVWTTFFAGVIMFKNLPKTVFGDVQAKLFPAYFSVQAISASAMTALAASGGNRSVAVASGAALALSLLNLAALEPLTTAAMYARRAAESGSDEAERKRANKRFGALHGMSSLANLLALGSGLTALWFLSEGMK